MSDDCLSSLLPEEAHSPPGLTAKGWLAENVAVSTLSSLQAYEAHHFCRSINRCDYFASRRIALKQKAISQAAYILIEHLTLFILEEEDLEEDSLPLEEGSFVGVSSEDPIFNANLLKSVDELELSVRSYNCLKNANIKTIADLVQKSEQEMLRTKNFGRKSLNEIKEILHTMGLRLGMRVDLEALSREMVTQSGGADKDATQS